VEEIGPVIMQTFPVSFRSLGDIGLGGLARVYLEIFAGAVVEDLRAAGSEISEPGDVLLGR
jgi:hypothetical protein